jgi:DDB1- and CUL4-associated factor 11
MSFPLDAGAEVILDFRLHIYDMTAPLADPRQALRRPTERLYPLSAPGEPTTMKVIKVIQGVSGGWTITDAHLSPDNERFAYQVLCIPVVYWSSPGSFTPRS